MSTEAKKKKPNTACYPRSQGLQEVHRALSLLFHLFSAVWKQTCSSRGCRVAGVPFHRPSSLHPSSFHPSSFRPSEEEADILKVLAIRRETAGRVQRPADRPRSRISLNTKNVPIKVLPNESEHIEHHHVASYETTVEDGRKPIPSKLTGPHPS